MKLAHPELQSRLAAEYVLGTLRGPARRRFETYLLSRADLRQAVTNWEAHLTPLAEHLPAVTPPDRVWQKIEARVGKAATASRASTASTAQNETALSAGASNKNTSKARPDRGLWSSLTFWRGLGLGASALASVLFVSAMFFRGAIPAATDPMLTAVLDDAGDARMVVEQPKSNLLMVKMVKPWMPAPGQSLQLWVICRDGSFRSLGMINQNGETKLAKEDIDDMLEEGITIALSKEPLGGSPTSQPTGMVLCKGVIARMPPKPVKTGKRVQGQI
jgi:anti-sigma-K factor RskA